ncbi:hypothetical protein [Botrimarina sp.]|uniref:hypothetical protein n=1 Tax=Botrimarina sp. TaxID=2795802 RepID=UPI0032ED9FA8
MAGWLLLAQSLATLYMTGVIWFVQLVQYPMLGEVPPERFAQFEHNYQQRMVWVVGPMMLLELATAVAMVWRVPDGVPGWVPWVGLGLLLVADGSTALFFGPQHGRLLAGYDDRLHRQLVDYNWLRTVAWTARALLLLWAIRCWATTGSPSG